MEYEERVRRLTEEAIEELKAVHIVLPECIRSVTINRRAKKRLGCCKKATSGGKVWFDIEISEKLKEKDDKFIKEVLLHELLHTCPGCLNHGAKWKQYAETVNRAYGYRIKTTAEWGDLSPQRKSQENLNHRYEICCTKCGNKGYRMKKSQVVVHPENYKCAKCGGKLTVKNLR